MTMPGGYEGDAAAHLVHEPPDHAPAQPPVEAVVVGAGLLHGAQRPDDIDVDEEKVLPPVGDRLPGVELGVHHLAGPGAVRFEKIFSRFLLPGCQSYQYVSIKAWKMFRLLKMKTLWTQKRPIQCQNAKIIQKFEFYTIKSAILHPDNF